MKPEFYRIYALGDPEGYCCVMAPEMAEQVTKEDLKQLRRGGSFPEKKLRFMLKGKKRGDLIRGEDFYFANERLKHLLEENRVSGVRFLAIELQSNRKLNDNYLLMSISGKAGPRKGSRHGPIEFDLARWDGSEVFMLDDTLHVLVVERVKTLITEAGLSNIGFERLENM